MRELLEKLIYNLKTRSFFLINSLYPDKSDIPIENRSKY